MTTMLITFNGTRDNGNFMGDQLCSLKAAYLFVQNQPDVDKVIMTMSPENEMRFVWQKFLDDPKGDGSIPPVDVIYDNFHPGDWEARFHAWDLWRSERQIDGKKFDHYRELYLRIHGAYRQTILCGSERGLDRRNIFEYWYYGQEHNPDQCVGSDWFDNTLCYHPKPTPTDLARDVYISPHCKTQGNHVFTFDFWSDVVHKLVNKGINVTIGYDGFFCPSLDNHPLYRRHWGSHEDWFGEVCNHKLVVCGNTGTGWVAAACGIPLLTMEPHNSQMPDHRYRECGLRNLVEVVDGYKLDELNNDMHVVADYVARRIVEETRRVIVMTTGCYDVFHAGHARHLQKARSLGTRLIVALNSDKSVQSLKGNGRPINNQDQRKAVLEAIRYVDEVHVFDELDAKHLISKIKPAVLACGYGYTEDTIVGKELVESWGGRAVVTCKEDASNMPQDPHQPSTNHLSTTRTIHKILRSGDITEICRIGATRSVNPPSKLRLMAEEFLTVSRLAGDVADLGAYKGGTSIILRKLAPDKHLHIFDTWEGNPYDDELCHHKKGEWNSSLKECQAFVGLDELTHYQQGIFNESLLCTGQKVASRSDFCFVYCDMDTYQSTVDAIEFFWPRMVSGGKMFFDDYGWEPCSGVKKAVDEIFRPTEPAGGFSVKFVQSQYACIMEKK